MSIKEIKQGKVKIDKDSVKATVDKEEIVKQKSAFDKLWVIFEGVKTDLITADKDRSLYSLVKGLKDIAVYPAPFGGKPNENVYTFKQKMLHTLATNQNP